MALIKIRYISDEQSNEIMLRTRKNTIVLRKYEWKEVEPEVYADLAMEYKTLLQREEDMIWDREIFKECKKKIAFRRTFALGDLIMLIPCINHLKSSTRNHYTLLTKACFIELFKSFGNFDDVQDIHKYRKEDFDQVLYLDGILERDHDLKNPDHLIHRTKLYEHYLGIKIDKYDWHIQPQNKKVEIERC